MTILMIAEKPNAAKAIANALSERKPKVYESEEGVKYYEFKKKGKKHIVVAAVGHLFTLKQKTKGWDYPVFDLEWIPSYKASRLSAFSKKYFDVVKDVVSKIGKKDEIIICTDYDDEGEVIGYNILKFLCNRTNAKRMKFSTMTKEELLESYENVSKSINKNLVEAGYARHFLDHMWGVSLTRALTLAIKNESKRFRILSTGRVQGPVLHMLAKHEKKIKAFKPKPFWQIEIEVKIGKTTIPAIYSKEKIWKEDESNKVMKKIKNKQAVVKDIKTKKMKQKPPKPYNTTSFLADVYRYFGYSPQQALSIAESLYQAGLISYPRTSSEKLPPDINYKKILSELAKQKSYEKDIKTILAGDLQPMEGKKTDPAHPAIYPTGQLPKKIGAKQKKVYDLVVRRFLAVFGSPALRESRKIILDVNGEMFYLNGIRTIEPGWTKLYGKYSKREEILLPDIKIGDKVKVSKTNKIKKETQPPARFSQGSVIKEMENRGLGTKATRAQIIQILYNRGYLIGKSIEVTELGMQLSNILERNVPDIVSEKLTRYFEKSTEMIELGKLKLDKILEEAKEKLIKISANLKKKEKKLGRELTKAVIAAQDKQNILGKCPNCGGILRVHKNWKTGKRFVGCSGYKKGCRTGYPLPKEGLIMSTDKVCEKCKTPIIQVQRQGSRPFRMCLDINCPTKKDWVDKKKLGK